MDEADLQPHEGSSETLDQISKLPEEMLPSTPRGFV